MSKEKEIIPDLRFPEFLNSGNWEVKEFGELIFFLSDYTANGSFAALKENVTYYTSEEYAVLVRTTDLEKTPFSPARFTDKKGYDFLSKTSLFGNEIVMANVGSIGKVYKVPFYDKPMTLAPNTYVLKFNDFVDEDFIYQLMLRTEFEHKLLSMVSSSTLMAINKKNLRSINIFLPRKPEQQKITSCLSSIDEVIVAHSLKLEALKIHKNGLMQSLFPKEGETIPKLRFKEFVKDGEWVNETLINFAVNGLSNGVFNDPQKVGQGYRLINVKDMYIETAISESKLSLLNISESEFLTNKVEFGDIFFTRSSLVATGIAVSNIFLGSSEDVTFDGHLIRLRPDKSMIAPIFLHYLLKTNNLRSQMIAKGKTATMTTIGQSDIASVDLFFPRNHKEQQKIASCLSSLDDLITAQSKKIEQLKLHKTGLMQGLFPVAG